MKIKPAKHSIQLAAVERSPTPQVRDACVLGRTAISNLSAISIGDRVRQVFADFQRIAGNAEMTFLRLSNECGSMSRSIEAV